MNMKTRVFKPGEITWYENGYADYESATGFPFDVVVCETVKNAIEYFNDVYSKKDFWRLDDGYNLKVFKTLDNGEVKHTAEILIMELKDLDFNDRTELLNKKINEIK